MPRLGLSIPASPAQRPLNSAAAPPMADGSALPPLDTQRRQPPTLSLATPMGTNQQVPHESTQSKRRGPPLVMPISGQSSDESARSRTNSFGASSSTQNGSVSAASSISAYNYADLLGGPNKDPTSAASSSASMERENSTQGIEVDLAKLTLELGREPDVRDLDDMGWKAAKKEGRIQELGSLGEGAGGAVTKCVLKGGKTVFALKVCSVLLSVIRA